jgi:aspartate ammonia-lyase
VALGAFACLKGAREAQRFVSRALRELRLPDNLPTSSPGSNRNFTEEHLESTPMPATTLNPHIGYEKAAVTSLPAYREELGLRAAALRPGCVWSQKTDRWPNPREMTGISIAH